MTREVALARMEDAFGALQKTLAKRIAASEKARESVAKVTAAFEALRRQMLGN